MTLVNVNKFFSYKLTSRQCYCYYY